MLIRLIVIFSLIISQINMYAQSQYNIIYDQQLGMNFAGENFVSAFHVFDYLDTVYIPKRIVKKGHKRAKFINPAYRFGKLFFTNYLFSDYLMTMNHERFGHGYRILRAEGEITEIVYNPPPPFSRGFSYISYTTNPDMTPQQQLSINFSGSETNMVLTDILRKNILLDGSFSYNYAIPYLYGSNDAPGYTAFVSLPEADPNQYRTNINNYYGGNFLSRQKMRRYSLLALFSDPMNFYAIKSVFIDYLFLGKHSSKVKMIRLSDQVRCLPRFRFEYTPYGIELVLQNYIKSKGKLYQLGVSFSDGAFDASWRIVAEAWNISLTEKLSFNLRGQAWRQPEINYFLVGKPYSSYGFGGQMIVVSNYNIISREYALGLTLHVGYKSKGYSLGEQLSNGLIVRGGLSFRLGNGQHKKERQD